MYSGVFKIWHWLNAIVISLLVGTVFLRETFFDKHDNAKLIISKLSEFSINLSNDQAILVAKAIREPLWEWHVILGYVLCGLLIYRFLLIFDKNTVIEKAEDLHMKLVKIFYKVLYFIIFVEAVTGVFLVFRKDLGFSRDIIHFAKDIHEICYYAILIFIPLHIIGVIIKNRKDKDLLNKIV